MKPGFASAEDDRTRLSIISVPLFTAFLLSSSSRPHVPESVIISMPVRRKSSCAEAAERTLMLFPDRLRMTLLLTIVSVDANTV